MPPPSTSSHNTNSQADARGPRELKIFISPLSPSSPSSSPRPPPTPCPWLWRCHSCYTIYRLAVTRRCLDCAHTFCLGDAAGGNGHTTGGKKSRRRSGPCKAEFDYTGWKARGAWRRTMLLNNEDQTTSTSTSTSTTNVKKKGGWGDEHRAARAAGRGDTQMRRFDDRREHLFLRKQHDCSLHCDFPSECHHALFRAQQEGRPILREALALDAARAAVAGARMLVVELEGGGNGGNNDSVRRRKTKTKTNKKATGRQGNEAATWLCSSSSEDEEEGHFSSLPPVDEEDTDTDAETISPCSPTSPDPPGDLMREVSPVEFERDRHQDPPVSPGGTAQHKRRSLLAATDTPADFATTAAALCFDDDDDDEALEFGPFVFDTTSPTSPSPGATNTSADLLQAAYSEQAWFNNSNPFCPPSTGVTTTTITADPPPPPPPPISPKSPERLGKRDRMLALLGRRGAAVVGGAGGGGSSEQGRCSSPPSSAPASSTREVDIVIEHAPLSPHHRHHGWDAWSFPPSLAPSPSPPATDADGDVTMRDASPPPPPPPPADEDEDEDEDEGVSPATPTPPRRQRSGGDGTDEDLRALLRMRNAFMRGEMV
ncbi:hypothetical protein KVR01_007612 [Diaporthe batatas]|uniref:uncharacterized protein n=1 Tax=Diaporthe batatas TaxID=748121 RepID=UPI001D053F04|nr:uncharacterized protein KVR01_007612 [Diaporthe batatas]KAG8163134.1 hypothetical protein KVR01_007612 [Diaporthe batatas]